MRERRDAAHRRSSRRRDRCIEIGWRRYQTAVGIPLELLAEAVLAVDVALHRAAARAEARPLIERRILDREMLLVDLHDLFAAGHFFVTAQEAVGFGEAL